MIFSASPRLCGKKEWHSRAVSGSETTIELNFAVLKFKHTIKKKSK
jgi:hypothetical protein